MRITIRSKKLVKGGDGKTDDVIFHVCQIMIPQVPAGPFTPEEIILDVYQGVGPLPSGYPSHVIPSVIYSDYVNYFLPVNVEPLRTD